MAQQTAVEWLLENMPKSVKIKLTDEGIKEYLQIREQAKAMEKEQIVNASSISYSAGQEYHMLKNNKLPERFAEQYYNETYRKP